jgi:hypothetical protein
MGWWGEDFFPMKNNFLLIKIPSLRVRHSPQRACSRARGWTHHLPRLPRLPTSPQIKFSGENETALPPKKGRFFHRQPCIKCDVCQSPNLRPVEIEGKTRASSTCIFPFYSPKSDDIMGFIGCILAIR